MAPAPGLEFDRLEFRHRLRTLDADAFEAFVADCWRARGWSVEWDRETLVVAHPTLGDRRRLSVRTLPGWRPGSISSTTARADPNPDVDVAVVNRTVPGAGDSVVDASDLHEMVRYGLDAETRATLVRDHLEDAGSPIVRVAGRVRPATRTWAASVAVVVAVLLVVVASVALLPGDQSASEPVDAGDSVSPTDAGGGRETPDLFAATKWPGASGGFPPGLAVDGITDPVALASTHVERASERPYELTLTVRESADGRAVGYFRERIRVRDRWTFASWIESSGDLRGDHPAVAGVEVYTDGTGLYVHAPGDRLRDRQAALQASPGDLAGIQYRVQRYLVGVLSVNESSVVETRQLGGTTLHRVDGTDRRPDGVVENVSVLVTAEGTVHAVHVERDVPGTDRSATVTVEYVYGPVIVDPPAWVSNESATVGRSVPLSKR